ncbi:hypothetical protein [Colwellia piezophila]|uniref:hypothetical protein n=1 Tax=Colwellia piezophila TaxID=211668 RepID=UPI000373A612|nr:hypothetical protein [Colwellia piezophila]
MLTQTDKMFIPKLLEAVCFRTLEQFMIKAPSFINGYSGEYAPAFSIKQHPCSVLKNGGNEEHDFLKNPRRVGLKTLYAALLISTMEQPFSSINTLPKGVFNSS